MAVPDAAATPSLSAAEALASTPFFSGLRPVDLARLVPELEELQFQQGQTVFRQGDPADALYLIRSGAARVTVSTENGAQAVRTLEAPETFGETALLTDEPRSADVVARTPLAVWRLPRERFEALVKEHPHVTLEMAASLANRLSETARKLSESQEQVAAVARATYESLDPVGQGLIRRAAVFVEFDTELLEAALGPAWSQPAFERLVQEAVFFRPDEEAPGRFRFIQESVRGFLLHQLRAELGSRGLADWQRRAADVLLARGQRNAAHVMALLLAAADWSRLAQLLEEQGPVVAERAPESVEGCLRALPERVLWTRPGLVCLLASCCAAQGKLEQGVQVYREAERRNPAMRNGPAAIQCQRGLAELYDRLGRQEDSLACLRRVREIEGQAGEGGKPDDGNAQLQTDIPPAIERDLQPDARRSDTSAPMLAPASPLAIVDWPGPSGRWLATLAIIALTALAWFLPPPSGLSVEGLRVLATLAALVALSFVDVLPDYLLALLVVAAWVVTGTLPPSVAAAGFTNPIWFLLLASMAIGAAVARSGLLYRGAIELVRHLPASHALRCLTLATLGVLFSPGMPSPSARVLLAAPLAQDIADSLRYPPRSGGSAGLALATFVGFGLIGTLFLTGNPLCLIVYGVFPPEVQARMSWGGWFVAALPTHLILFTLTMLFLVARYRPEGTDDVPEETLALQRRVLGRLSRDEWSALVIVGFLLIAFSTQSLHGIDPAWLSVAAVAALFVTRALDDPSVQNGVNLSFLLYIGVLLGFGQIFAHVQLERWLGQSLAELASITGGSATAFVMAVAFISAILALVLRPGPIAVLLALVLFPTAAAVGVDPWVVAMTVLLATNLWLYPQQHVLYLSAYHATGERAFSHAQARPLAFAYTVAVFIAILLSIPYWRWLGLIH